jgi:hypothetical protein
MTASGVRFVRSFMKIVQLVLKSKDGQTDSVLCHKNCFVKTRSNIMSKLTAFCIREASPIYFSFTEITALSNYSSEQYLQYVTCLSRESWQLINYIGKTILVTGRGGRGGPHISRQSAHRWRWGCQPYAPPGRLHPRKIPDTHFC